MKEKLFHPFDYIAGKSALLVGIAVAAISVALGALAGVRFDGVLDAHITKAPYPAPWELLLEQIIIWVSLSIMWFGAGALLKLQSRTIDVLGTISMARIPMLLAGFVTLLLPEIPEMATMSTQSMQTYFMENAFAWISFGLLGLALIVYYVQLLWQSFKTCFNAKGHSNAILLFIAALILAEIISKSVLFTISYFK